MPKQAALFAPDPAADTIARAAQRGQRVTPWAEHAVREWFKRGVRMPSATPNREMYERYGVSPSICDCTRCGGVAVIFPPEDGAPQGYCICPRCSIPSANAASSTGKEKA